MLRVFRPEEPCNLTGHNRPLLLGRYSWVHFASAHREASLNLRQRFKVVKLKWDYLLYIRSPNLDHLLEHVSIGPRISQKEVSWIDQPLVL